MRAVNFQAPTSPDDFNRWAEEAFREIERASRDFDPNALDFLGTAAQGDVIYRGATNWARLPAGTSGYVLSTLGASANPLWVPRRELLIADRTYYVRTDGSNSNTGLANTAGGAFLTKQKAMDVIAGALDLGGQTVTTQIADGTYAGGLQIKPWLGGGVVQFQGNAATPANVLVSTASPTNCIDASFGPLPGIFRLKDMKLKCAAGGTGFPLIARSPGRVQYTNIVFDSAPLAHVVAATQGVIEPYGNNSIVGAASVSHFISDRIGLIDVTARDLPSAIGTYTVSGGLTFGQFAAAATQSAMVLPGITFAGAGAGMGTTGRTYSVSGSAIINTQGSGDFYLPGDAAGERINSGQYI